jgi:hypothetical protein
MLSTTSHLIQNNRTEARERLRIFRSISFTRVEGLSHEDNKLHPQAAAREGYKHSPNTPARIIANIKSASQLLHGSGRISLFYFEFTLEPCCLVAGEDTVAEFEWDKTHFSLSIPPISLPTHESTHMQPNYANLWFYSIVSNQSSMLSLKVPVKHLSRYRTPLLCIFTPLNIYFRLTAWFSLYITIILSEFLSPFRYVRFAE